MAIQVRLDLTPAEFDLTRRALDSYRKDQFELSKGSDPETRKQRQEAGQEVVASGLLIEKLNR